ncbi:MAG: AMP-binding protein [Aquificota bacterium]|nr:AMP-binding protein [Aquificota bacterium]
MIRDHRKTALIHRGREITYRELIDHINSFANLTDVLPDERVMIVSENRPEWVYALYGTWKRGGVVVPVDFLSTPEEIAYIIRDSEPKIVFCSETTRENAEQGIRISGRKVDLVNFDRVTLPRPVEKSVSRERDDLALILYTSGTTGKPKGVMLTFKNLKTNIDGVVDAGIAGRDDRTLAILPFHHAYPLMVTLLVPMYIGATVVFLDRLTPEDIMDKLKRYRITILVGVPRLYTLFHRRIMEEINSKALARLLFRLMRSVKSVRIRRFVFKRVHEAFGGNIRYFVSGGAKLDPEIAEDLMTLGFTVIEGYGLTETSPIVTFNPPERIKVGSAGVPIKNVFVKISPEGEILVKGPNVMKGYWRKPDETAKVIRHGWFHTGDLGYMDDEEYLYITGRKKEIIVLGTGKNVHPEEIENLILRESELVKEVGVFELNGKIHAVIHPDFEKVKRSGVVNLHETIKWEVVDRVNRKLPEWKRIAGFRITENELPKTRLGKLRRFLLPDIYSREEVEKKEEEDLSVLNTEEGRIIGDFLKKLTGLDILPSHHIELDLGLDSLGKVELTSFLEKTFGVSLTEEDLSSHSRVRDLIEFVRFRKEKVETGTLTWKDILEKAEPYTLHDHRVVFWLGRRVLRVFFTLYNRVEVSGTENLPQKPFIIAPNHVSYLDAFVIASVLPEEVARDTYFLGEEVFFRNPITSLFGRLAHVITVNINRDLKGSLQKVSWALRMGKVVVIFPEGARTRTGDLMEFKKGTAIISRELNIPVVPTALIGLYEVMSVYDRFPKPKKIRVVFGEPLYPEGKSYEEITQEMKKRVETLLRESRL